MKHNIKQFIILALMLVGNITTWAMTKTITYTLDRTEPDFNFVLEGDNGEEYVLGKPASGNLSNPLEIDFQDVDITITSSDPYCHIGVTYSGFSGFYGHGVAFEVSSTDYYVSHVTIMALDRMWVQTVETDNNSKQCILAFPYDEVLIQHIIITLTDTKPLLDIANATVSGIADSYDYTGSAIVPAINDVTLNTGILSLGTLTLTEGTDYTVSYTNNTNAGTATMTLTGKGEYTGTWSKTFAINKVAPTVTVPEPVTTGYQGTTQALCSAGAVTGGTLMYSIDGGLTWSADVPTAIHAASYNVNYRVIADQSHIDVAPTLAGTATINSRQQTFGTVTVTDGHANSANNTIVIADGTDDVTIAEHVPGIGSVTMERTFTPGKAATMMLPFDIDISKVSGGTFYGYVGVDKNGSEWDVVMQEVNRVSGTLQAHTPYLFMPTAEHITFNLGGTTVTLKANSQQTYTVEPY